MGQKGFIFRKGGSWFLRYRDDVIEDGQIVRKQQCKRLAPVCDQYRTEKDLQGLREETLGPINSGKVRPESTLTIAEFAERHWLPWARENCKPSTVAEYQTTWKTYLSPYLQKVTPAELSHGGRGESLRRNSPAARHRTYNAAPLQVAVEWSLHAGSQSRGA